MYNNDTLIQVEVSRKPGHSPLCWQKQRYKVRESLHLPIVALSRNVSGGAQEQQQQRLAYEYITASYYLTSYSRPHSTLCITKVTAYGQVIIFHTSYFSLACPGHATIHHLWRERSMSSDKRKHIVRKLFLGSLSQTQQLLIQTL